MADLSLPSTLGTQPTSSGQAAPAAVGVGFVDPALTGEGGLHDTSDGGVGTSLHNEGGESVTPQKRKPGRPKGSGKKPYDPNAPPKEKRPVGRPRKDGLPAGSVPGARRASGRPRKRPPGTFATGFPPGGSVSAPPGAGGYYAQPAGWPHGSTPPMGSLRNESEQLAFPIDPNLESADWSELANTNPNLFLHALIVSLTAPNPLPKAGPAVEEAFKSHLVSLAPNPQQQQATAIPSLYSILKTFWLPCSPAYFSMTASGSTARTPSEHRFLYWDPQPLVFNGIACPHCSAPLINKGRIKSGPIKVYDLNKPFFIIGCEYVCKSHICAPVSPDGRKFASTDSSVLRSLPSILADEFPAHLLQGAGDAGCGPAVWNWKAMGVSKALWNMVRGCLMAGLKKDAILSVVRVIQYGVMDGQNGGGSLGMGWGFPTAAGAKMEEEGADDDDDDDDDEDDEGIVERSVQDDGGQDGGSGEQRGGAQNQANPADAYNNAWKANSGVPGTTNNGQPVAGPSNTDQSSNGANSNNQHPPPPPPAQFGYGQGPSPYPPYAYGAYPYFAPQPPLEMAHHAYQHGVPPDHPAQHPNTLKRTFGGDDMGGTEPAAKRTRHCCKCGSQDCKGKGGRAFCVNPCQDCGRMDCKGRNSKRPDKTCADAWP
ncbi:hypothetical protein JAAARDRAFT_33977 [Jaapia argillacea MUCL 33604]|uniref:Post-SET domain-containing protein n=1 Tax=Jaapia argillacea MUCL 33604 TaxID=933084 RepID=A0A067PX03_9AGAM|nr:hypothetical protein JAAARDRAFT_33977 [Jaapia argillacea MUCL 33604]